MAVLCLGKFDGLHRGHLALVERASSAWPGSSIALLSFTGMAEALGWPTREPLIAHRDRMRILAEWPGPPHEVRLPFAEVRPLDLAGFCGLIRDRLVPQALVVGDDFRGGRDRSGNAAELVTAAAAQGIAVAVVPAVTWAGAPVSSSRVRAAVGAGEVTLAADLLGRPHRLIATVVRGDGRGRSLGFPTANCAARENLAPGTGVYAGRARLASAHAGPDRWWPAAVNIGHLPTVSGDRPLTVEAHLVGFSGDCYGARIEVEFLRRLRGEQRFASLEALKAQIAIDVAAAAIG
ncbi:riboflavin biosynthesis protein [Planctomycetota bacterium]|nr:riboflavin biosynthesis protein [Planctomycetota bacterium]